MRWLVPLLFVACGSQDADPGFVQPCEEMVFEFAQGENGEPFHVLLDFSGVDLTPNPDQPGTPIPGSSNPFQSAEPALSSEGNPVANEWCMLGEILLSPDDRPNVGAVVKIGTESDGLCQYVRAQLAINGEQCPSP